MIPADAWKPVDFLAEFRKRESTCQQWIDLVKELAESEAGKLWAHHLPRLVDALEFFRHLCQDEIDHYYGGWRYHGFQLEEVLQFVDEDLGDLVAWICRIRYASSVGCDFRVNAIIIEKKPLVTIQSAQQYGNL